MGPESPPPLDRYALKFRKFTRNETINTLFMSCPVPPFLKVNRSVGEEGILVSQTLLPPSPAPSPFPCPFPLPLPLPFPLPCPFPSPLDSLPHELPLPGRIDNFIASCCGVQCPVPSSFIKLITIMRMLWVP